MSNDLINGLFELASGLFCIINIFVLVRDKTIKGVSWIPTFFYAAWGGWNLYFYPSLGQILSFWGGIVIFGVNLIWLSLLFYYKYRK
jgi:hypothetical protein